MDLNQRLRWKYIWYILKWSAIMSCRKLWKTSSVGLEEKKEDRKRKIVKLSCPGAHCFFLGLWRSEEFGSSGLWSFTSRVLCLFCTCTVIVWSCEWFKVRQEKLQRRKKGLRNSRLAGRRRRTLKGDLGWHVFWPEAFPSGTFSPSWDLGNVPPLFYPTVLSSVLVTFAPAEMNC